MESGPQRLPTASRAAPDARSLRDLARSLAATAGTACVVVVVALLGLVGFHAIADRAIAIRPLAVPPALADAGFSGDVAATRLADDINGLTLAAREANAKRVFEHPQEPPELVIPTLGLSVQALAAKLDAYFGLERQQVVSGEFTIAGDRLFLRVKLNDKPIFSAAQATGPQHAGAMLDQAARAVLGRAEPYLLASAEYAESRAADAPDTDAHRAKALAAVDALLAALPPGDGQLKYAHLLKATILRDAGQAAAARAQLEAALKLDPHFAAALADLGAIEAAAGETDKALAAYDAAIAVKPGFAGAHAGKAKLLARLGRADAAAAEREACAKAQGAAAKACAD